MAIRTQHDLTENTWFITFTCYNWLPLFQLTQSYDLVYNWLKIIESKYQIKTLAFVIMPNHVHAILYLSNSQLNLNMIIGNGKRFMAYELVERLKRQQQHEVLYKLSSGCSELEILKGQKHKVFEVSFDAKPIFTSEFLHQKLDYIHHNPVIGKWHLCDEFTDYPHSSAAFYVDNKSNEHVTITHYRDY